MHFLEFSELTWSFSASQKIREAGGKPIGEKYVEGTSGWIHDFQDTEGNYGGIYSLKNDK